jgi:hypothetical protein
VVLFPERRSFFAIAFVERSTAATMLACALAAATAPVALADANHFLYLCSQSARRR